MLSNVTKYLVVIVILFVPFVWACSNTRILQEENTLAADLIVPQIDIFALAVTETATFALG